MSESNFPYAPSTHLNEIEKNEVMTNLGRVLTGYNDDDPEIPEDVELDTDRGQDAVASALSTGLYELREPTVAVVSSEEEPRYKIELFKVGRRSTSEEKLTDQLNYISDRIFSGSRSRRWKLVSINQTYRFDSGKREHNYRAAIVLQPLKIDAKTEQEFLIIHKIAHKAAEAQRWECEDPEVNEIDMESKIDADIEWNGNWYEDYFDHIYGRKNQIDIVMSALKAGVNSDFENRFHCLLFGDPACGKTEIAKSFKAMLGQDAVLEFDATSTTAAGAIKDLAEREILPKLLVIEEMEKTDENSLRWLLSVLDHRGEIRKINFNQNIQRDVKLMCLATVNDYELFKKLMYGAVASRFSHHIHCPRPDNEVLRMILTREVAKVTGKPEWIDKAIEFANMLELTDPRKVTAICLCGADDLLDGSYQKKMIACLPPRVRGNSTASIEDPKTIKGRTYDA